MPFYGAPAASSADEFVDSARTGRVEGVRTALKAGQDVNATDRFGYTALFCAVTNSHLDVVGALLATPGILVDKPVFSETPLCRAALSASAAVMETLLAAGGNPNARTSAGWTPLMCAVGTAGEVAGDSGGRTTKVRALLALPGLDIAACDRQGNNAVALAQRTGRTELAQEVQDVLTVQLRWELSLRSTWTYLCVRLDHSQAPASLFGPLQSRDPATPAWWRQGAACVADDCVTDD